MGQELIIPLSEDDVRNLRVGDEVHLSGVIYTGRDAVHQHLASGGLLPDGVSLKGGVIYHCGPVVVRSEEHGWRVIAAGPTTSVRHEPYQAILIERFGLRGIIGKGGMGPKTLEACRRFGCVYFHAVGGAAQVLGERIVRVRSAYFLERFGAPEAMWELEVSRFPVVVTIDAHGRSLHTEIELASRRVLERLLAVSVLDSIEFSSPDT